MKKKLLVYDFDNTLNTNGNKIHYDAYREALESQGVVLADELFSERIEQFWGATHFVINDELCREHPKALKGVNDSYLRYMRKEYPEKVRPVRDSVEMLGRLAAAGYRQAIATATESNTLHRALKNFGLKKNVIHRVVTAYDVERYHKPHPRHLQRIMLAEGVQPEESLVIGDSFSDIHMAYASGVDVVVVRTGDLKDGLAEEVHVDRGNILEDVTYLEDFLGRLSLSGVG